MSSWRLDRREFHAFGVRRTRNSARRTLVSTVEVHIGSCWRISVPRDQAGQLQDVIMSDRYAGLRPTCTRCMSTQSLKIMRNLICSQCRLWRTGVMYVVPRSFSCNNCKVLAVPVRRQRPVIRCPVMPTDIMASPET